MTTPTLIKTTQENGVMVITINRPEKRNALNAEMIVRLADAWQIFRESRELRVAVLTGAGNQQFCAGADLKSLEPLVTGHRPPQDSWDEQILADPRMIYKAVLYGVDMDKPVIAALNGDALGGGAELMLTTHLRVAAAGSQIGLPAARWATVSAGGGMVQLPRQVSFAHAMELLLTADPISAEKAQAIGLVNRVVPAERVLEEAQALAVRVAENGPVALAAALNVVRSTATLSVVEAQKLEAELIKPVFASKDILEGMKAFAEKRKPNYQGK
ncbi:MAG: enoyl-CoA hydratase-related protein [Porticoccaceae bacterium]|nr:enoyl-CoA hydratase-related protein [Porticoccaceae bacterium]